MEAANETKEVRAPADLCPRGAGGHFGFAFFQTSDVFRTGIVKQNYAKSGKTGELSKLSGESKSEKPVRPQGGR